MAVKQRDGFIFCCFYRGKRHPSQALHWHRKSVNSLRAEQCLGQVIFAEETQITFTPCMIMKCVIWRKFLGSSHPCILWMTWRSCLERSFKFQAIASCSKVTRAHRCNVGVSIQGRDHGVSPPTLLLPTPQTPSQLRRTAYATSTVWPRTKVSNCRLNICLQRFYGMKHQKLPRLNILQENYQAEYVRKTESMFSKEQVL